MTRERLTDIATITLGCLYVAAGVAETIRVLVTGDGGLVFWFGSLVGGGTAILLGLLVFRDRPRVYRALVVIGAVVGVLATMWTLVVPVLAVAVVVLTFQRVDKSAAPGT